MRDPDSDTHKKILAVHGAVETGCGFYPGIEFFSTEFAADDYRDWVEESNGDPVPAPLALYIQDTVHNGNLPEKLRAGSAGTTRVAEAIDRELRLQGALFDSDRPLQQLICSGLIASSWPDDHLYRLVSRVQESFYIDRGGLGNWCACMGPVVPDPARLRLLRILGFSNLRFALVDVPGHQQNTSRLHESMDEIRKSIRLARETGFSLLAVDLHYQPEGAMDYAQELLEFLGDADVDRFRLVREPSAQADYDFDNQPDEYETRLLQRGYQNIGLDWFVQSDDPWWQARKSHLLNWSILGFTNMLSPDVIGVGPGAVCSIGDYYGQVETRWNAYSGLLEKELLPIARGLELEADDLLRREVMAMILADSCIRVNAIEDKWGIGFHEFFGHEIEHLREFKKRGLVEWQGGQIDILSRRTRDLAAICGVFERRNRSPVLHAVSSSG